jgi:hypothetical protein
LLAEGTKKGTNRNATAELRQLTDTTPLRNVVLAVHQASSRMVFAAIDVSPELGNHRPIL